ncbi:MAG: glycosyltransferase family 4 protein [Elusimicrobiales bacterium]
MKVLFVIAQYPPVVGGAEIKASRLARALAARGHEITVLTRRLPGTPALENDSGADIIRLGGERGVRADLPAFAREIFRRRGRVDALHNFLLSSLTNICCLARGSKTVISAGGAGAFGGPRDTSGFGRFAGLKWRHIAASGARFICPAPHCAREFKEAGIAAERIFTVPNPADTARLSPASPEEKAALRRGLGLPENEKIFLFAGRFEHVKGGDRIIRAFLAAKPEGARLVMAGSGSLDAQWRAMAARGGVIFAGAQADISGWQRAADFFALPSRSEGMSNALVEAMACGAVPLACESGGTEMVENGRTGFSLPNTDDAAPLAEAVRKAAALSAGEYAEFSRAARQTVERGYSMNAVIPELERIYESL